MEDDNVGSNSVVLFVDSQQGFNRSSDGAAFTVNLRPPLRLPMTAKPILKVIEANVVYTQHNIKEDTTLYITLATSANSTSYFNSISFPHVGSFTSGINTSTTTLFTVDFPAGLYTLADINDRIVAACEQSTFVHDNAFSVRGINPTQKVELDFDAEAVNDAFSPYIHWTGYPGTSGATTDADTIARTAAIGTLLGYSKDDFIDVSAGDKHYYVQGDVVANFDSFSHYVLSASCCAGNYEAGGQGGTGQVAAITPDVTPGSTIHYRPVHPLPCLAQALAGTTSSIRFRMTTNSGEDAILNEAYSARILIEW